MELVNAGMDHLHFQNITIVELGNGTYRNSSTAKGINTKEKFEIMNRVIKNARTYDLDALSDAGGESRE
ncbi:hypothetical protein ACUXKS_000566 [Staphylococcus capitis]